MLRKFVCSLCALLLGVGVLIAAEIKGKVKGVDEDKKTITVTVDDKDTTYTFTDDTKIMRGNKDVPDRAKALKGLGKNGAEVTLTTDKKDDKEVVTQIKLGGKKKQQ